LPLNLMKVNKNYISTLKDRNTIKKNLEF
jgi:hypothetical protein